MMLRVTTEIDRDETIVPHYLPGAHPFLTEYAERHGLPLEAVLGGAETALPEYQRAPRRARLIGTDAAGQGAKPL